MKKISFIYIYNFLGIFFVLGGGGCLYFFPPISSSCLPPSYLLLFNVANWSTLRSWVFLLLLQSVWRHAGTPCCTRGSPEPTQLGVLFNVNSLFFFFEAVSGTPMQYYQTFFFFLYQLAVYYWKAGQIAKFACRIYQRIVLLFIVLKIKTLCRFTSRANDCECLVLF